MSSERAGGLNRDWPGRADVLRSYGGELDQDMVDQLDRAHTPSERAGVHTSPDTWEEKIRSLDSLAIGDVVIRGNSEQQWPLVRRTRAGMPTHGALDREAARAMVAAEFTGSTPSDRLLDALEACVVPDPRLGRIEALIEEPWVGSTPDGRAVRMGMRAILRGAQ